MAPSNNKLHLSITGITAVLWKCSQQMMPDLQRTTSLLKAVKMPRKNVVKLQPQQD
jgi:hypothetical protein